MNIHEENRKQLQTMKSNFKRLREARNWSVKELSERCGIDEKILALIEDDENFNVQFLIDLCRFYHVPIRKIFTELLDENSL